MSSLLKGLIAAAHTPFAADGSLAPDVVATQARFLAGQGLAGVFIAGSTGEAHSLTRDERLQLLAAWATAGPAHRLPVIAHVGSNCLEDAKAFAACAADLKLAAIAAFAPSYYKPATLDDLVTWCATIAGAAPSLPFYYYDIPTLTGVEFSMTEFLEAATPRIPTFAGIKFTNSDLGQFESCLKLAGDRFELGWGIDERLLDALQTGAIGAVGSSYNFIAPLYHSLIAAHRDGDIEQAAKLQALSVDFIEALAAVGYLGAAKAYLGWLGVPVGPARQPIPNPSPTQLTSLREKLDKLHARMEACELSCGVPA